MAYYISDEPGYNPMDFDHDPDYGKGVSYAREYPSYNPMDFDHDPDYGKGVSYGVLRIQGQDPHILIQEGKLTKENMLPEYKECIYSELVRGYVTDKNLIAKELELIIDDKELLSKLIYRVYSKAIEEMHLQDKSNSYVNTNHVYNFLSIISILMAKDFDVYSLSFENKSQEENLNIMNLMAKFKEQANSNRASDIADPSWDKEGTVTKFGIKETSPYLYSSELIRNLYVNHPNPQIFVEEYNEYLASKKPGDYVVSFEESMRYKYGLVLPKGIDNLQQFKEARERQMQQDQIIREQQLSGLNREMSESKEGHTLR